jgi:TonB family protein
MRRRVWAVALLAFGVGLSGAGAPFELASAQDRDPAAQDHSAELKRKVKSKVLPEYPAIARQLKLQGRVKVEAAVAADGHVASTRVLGGNPLLASAAAEAIKKWRYETAPKETRELIEIEFTGQD